MSCGSTDIDQKLFEVLLSLKCILVEERHLGDRDDFAALLQEDGDADVFSEGKQRIKVSLNFLIAALLVKFLEVFPEALEGSRLYHIQNYSNR